MFENEISLVTDETIKKIQIKNSYAYLSDILENESIHRAYRKYMEAETDWLLFREQLIRESNKLFDLDNPEIKNQQERLDKLYKTNARFTENELKSIIESAVKIRLNFLLRPRTTIKWFVYRGSLYKSIEEINKRMNYFTDYNYLANGFINHCDSEFSGHLRQNISFAEFSNIIVESDNNEMFRLTPHEFIAVLNPVFDFFKHAGYDNVMPIDALVIYLEDKELTPLANSFSILKTKEKMDTLSREDILYGISEILDEINTYQEDTQISDIPTESDFSLELDSFEEKEPIIEEETPGVFMEFGDKPEEIEYQSDHQRYNESYNVSAIKQNREETEVDYIELESVFFEEINNFKYLKNTSKFIVMEETFRHDIFGNEFMECSYIQPTNTGRKTSIPGSIIQGEVVTIVPELPDISKFLNEKQENKIIKKIFSKDLVAYFEFLKTINNSYTWKEAARQIDLLFASRSIDPDSSIACEFRDAINDRYI